MNKLLLSSFSLLTAFLVTTVGAAAEKPNLIVIMADDLGYGDVSCYGADSFKTPNIDQLAAEGIRFTNGYCSASTCTPTRYSFLTGNYAFRFPGTGIAAPSAPAIIKPDVTTLPSLLQKGGYKTAVIGKWHLGLGGKTGPDWNGELRPGPAEIGFNYHFLLPTTNDRVPQVYVENSRVLNLDPNDPLWVGRKKPSEDHPTGITHRDTLKMDWTHGHNQTIHNGISRIGFYTGGKSARFRDEDLADEWVKQSRKWIGENKDEPFFLFFASHDIHVPRIPHERFQGSSGLGYRGDCIIQLDWCVGEIMKIIDENELAEDTMIVFCSDNGPVMDDGYADEALEKLGNHKAGGPFTGGKYSIYEGGTRTPFITRWKGKIQPAVSDKVVCTIDLGTSLANYAGVEIPENALLDSLDVMDALLGDGSATGRDHLVQQGNRSENLSLRVGDWKLLHHRKGQGRNLVVEKLLENTEVPEFQLIDLSKDPAEEHNVMDQHPAKGEELKARLKSIVAGGRTRN